MNIDKKIQQELKEEANQLDNILAHEPGVFNMLLNAYKGSLGAWIVIVSIVTLCVSAIMVWAGYQFFIGEAKGLEHQVYWGVVLLVSVVIQVALKMWTFMEMNRQSTLREIKRLELMIEKLVNKLT